MNRKILVLLLMAIGSAHAETTSFFEVADPFCEKADEPNPPNANCTSTKKFVDQVLKSDDVVIVMATAKWCVYCAKFENLIPEVMQQFQGKPIRFLGINYDKNSELLSQIFGIDLLPSIHVFYKGERRWKFYATPGSSGAAVRDFGYALEASEKGDYRIDHYPTLLKPAEPLADQILKFADKH